MGSAQFSVPSLHAIASSEHTIVGVLTNPGKPAGRGLKNRNTPVADIARTYGIDLLTPAILRDNRDAAGWIRLRTPDVIVVVAYGKLIPPEILSIPVHGCLNLHPSLLPKYRGAAPLQRAIMNGDENTGITVMLLDKGMDSGPVYLQEEVAIGPQDNAVTLGEKLAILGAGLLIKTLSSLDQKSIEPVLQQHEHATLAPKITKEEGELDFSKSAADLHNTVRALIEWPTAWTFYRGGLIQVLAAEYDTLQRPEPPGTVIVIDKRGIHAATGNGTLIIKSVKPAGGRAMDAQSYANGKRMKTGELLGGENLKPGR